MWYKNSYRRNLVDMHIEDWNTEFLSEFSPDEYYNNLVLGKIQSPMIYLQSHIGHCYFPTKTGHMHNALVGKEDMIKRLVDKCRDGGMNVVGYYSLIYNTYEEDRHPEWKIHDGGGKSPRDKGGRYGLCCPNNTEYRDFVFEQIKEIAEYFTLDGMFYDMLFWAEVCRCGSCKKRFAEEVGGDIPAEVNWNDERWLAFSRKRSEWMGEFAMTVTNETKRLMPHVSVEHNYASGVAGDWFGAATELVNDACDYTGGDLYGDLYNHSFTCKYYMNITKNAPFEYMTCRCANHLGHHTITKTKEALELEIMLTCAHHGASFIIDAVDPKGTMDRRVYERVGEIFARHMEYEPYLEGSHIADIGVYYSTSSRYNRDGENFTNKTCSINTVKTLIENHVPVGVVSNGCTDKMRDYKFIFAPYLFDISTELADKFINYVNEGRFVSIHSDPPGIRTDYPALVVKKCGKGTVIWSAVPIEFDERIHYKKLLMNLMELCVVRDNLTLSSSASKNVEIIAFKTTAGYLVSAVDLKYTEERIPVRAFDIRIKTCKPVKTVMKLPEMKDVGFEKSESGITLNTGELDMFAMYKIIEE